MINNKELETKVLDLHEKVTSEGQWVENLAVLWMRYGLTPLQSEYLDYCKYQFEDGPPNIKCYETHLRER